MAASLCPLFALCPSLPFPSLVGLPLHLPGLDQEEREKLSRFYLFGTDTVHQGSLWDGRILFLTLSFDWCFVNFEESLLPWNIPVFLSPMGFLQFLPQPLDICGHLLQPGIESEIAPDWLLPQVHFWPRSHTLPCPTVGGYLACSQCSLMPLTLPPPPAHLIWSVSLTSPYILQTQGGTFEALRVVSVTHLSHLVQGEGSTTSFTQKRGKNPRHSSNSPKITSLLIFQLQCLSTLQVGGRLRVTPPV